MSNAWDAARKDSVVGGGPELSDSIRGALLKHLQGRDDQSYDGGLLHYGSDLYPGTCERKIWYRLNRTRRDEEALGSQLRFEGGRHVEETILGALEGAGHQIKRQVVVRPRRPSSWAWIGRADAVVLDEKKLLEIKGPRAALFARAKGDPTKLAKEQYRWQASAYYHELRRRRLVDRASFVFVDREGANEPVELEIAGDLLIPEEAIVAEEERKARLVTATETPDRVGGVVVVEVLKGGRATKKNPAPERLIRAVSKLNWQCEYGCPYRSTCKPEVEKQPVEFVPAKVIAEAERRWAAGAKRIKFVLGDGGEDEDEYLDELEAETVELVDRNDALPAGSAGGAGAVPALGDIPQPSVEGSRAGAPGPSDTREGIGLGSSQGASSASPGKLPIPADVGSTGEDAPRPPTSEMAAPEPAGAQAEALPDAGGSPPGAHARPFTLEDGLSRLGRAQIRHAEDLVKLGDGESAGGLSSAILSLAARWYGEAVVGDHWNRVGGEIAQPGPSGKARRKPLTGGQLRALLLGLPVKFPPESTPESPPGGDAITEALMALKESVGA